MSAHEERAPFFHRSMAFATGAGQLCLSIFPESASTKEPVMISNLHGTALCSDKHNEGTLLGRRALIVQAESYVRRSKGDMSCLVVLIPRDLQEMEGCLQL